MLFHYDQRGRGHRLGGGEVESKGGDIYVEIRDGYDIPPVLGLLVTAQFVQPVEFIAALWGVR